MILMGIKWTSRLAVVCYIGQSLMQQTLPREDASITFHKA